MSRSRVIRSGEGERIMYVRTMLATLSLLTLCLAGCLKPEVRAQTEDEPENRYPIKTVGDVTAVGNIAPIPVGGVGLVINLDGTGSNPRKSNARKMLEHALRKGKNRDLNVKKLLASPNTSLVLISGMIPAGARKGDTMNLEVTLPAGSRTTSLKGGYLYKTSLRTYARAGDISRKFADSDASIMGRPVALAEGPVQIIFGTAGNAQRLKKGWIYKGGHSLIQRPFSLLMKPGNQFARLAKMTADRVNSAFHNKRDVSDADIASAKSNQTVMLSVPARYRRNLRRYMRVVRYVPLSEAYTNEENAPSKSYRSRLREDVLDPAFTVQVAMRLEALGADSVPVLRRGLKSNDPLVRFSCAEALTYLGDTAGVGELAKAVEKQPYFRAFALTAMASLDESICHTKLRDLLWSEGDDETRYGAFRALKALDERDPALTGKRINNAFWLHHVAPQTKKPFVHLSLGTQAEIVMFGEIPKLNPPFALSAGEHVVTAGEDDQRCTVSYFPRDGRGVSRRRCSLDLASIINTMATHGASYEEIVNLVQQADRVKTMSCRVRKDALPQATSVYELAQAGKLRKRLQENPNDKQAREMLADLEIIKPDEEHSITPTLFEQQRGRGSAIAHRQAQQELLRKKKSGKEKETAFLE